MKRAILILAGALLAGTIAFFICYGIATQPIRGAASVQDELRWLTTEFQLTPAQTKRIEVLHAAYQPRCAEMCRKIAGNNAQLDRHIKENREFSPEMGRLLQESAQIQAECRREMLEHIYAVAAEMPAGQGERYISLLKAQVLQPGTPGTLAAGAHSHE